MFVNMNEFTWLEREARKSEHMVYVLPISALEQHGQHLPLGTDDFILQAVLHALCADPSLKTEYICLPAIHYGCSWEHMDFIGTITIRSDTLLRIVEDIISCAHCHGVKKLLIINSHGGNTAAIGSQIREWERKYQIHIYFISFFNGEFYQEEFLPVDTPVALDIHAGEIETSVMMDQRPELVRTDKISKNLDYCGGIEEFDIGWASGAVNPGSGVIGAASCASREKGRQIFTYMVNRIRKFLLSLEES